MFISVEGCIGSGKTTVAKLLAAERNLNCILENHKANPFIDKFYSNPSRYALETELAFVLIHYHQVFHKLKQVKNGEYISDFHISKDLLFAKMNLDKKDLIIFKNLYTALTERLPVPDVIVCLQCSDKLLLKRIEGRKRDVETQTTPQYFIKLNRLYKEYFEEIEWPKVLISMDERDFVKDPSCIQRLSREIDEFSRA
ncbi:MAG TPA: deoxynucleoside kinase [Sedimentisphaerales bacterium]|nr:deoxynucleoside kinase [Sedimentisphaerales bacterium]